MLVKDQSVRDRLVYARLIVREALRHGGWGWLDYDRLFRQQAALDPSLQWGTLHPSLVASTVLSHRSGSGSFCSLWQGFDHSPADCAMTFLRHPTRHGFGPRNTQICLRGMRAVVRLHQGRVFVFMPVPHVGAPSIGPGTVDTPRRTLVSVPNPEGAGLLLYPLAHLHLINSNCHPSLILIFIFIFFIFLFLFFIVFFCLLPLMFLIVLLSYLGCIGCYFVLIDIVYFFICCSFGCVFCFVKHVPLGWVLLHCFS